jgi:hypothetical protein
LAATLRETAKRYLLRVNLTEYGCKQDCRAQPSDDVNERRDFQPQHFEIEIQAQLAKDASIDRRGPQFAEANLWCGCMVV